MPHKRHSDRPSTTDRVGLMKSGLSLCRIHSVAFLTTCAPYVSVRWCSAPQTAAGQFAAIPQDCHLFPRIFQALPTVLPGRPLLISKVDRECSYCLTPEPPRPGGLRGFWDSVHQWIVTRPMQQQTARREPNHDRFYAAVQQQLLTLPPNLRSGAASAHPAGAFSR